MTSYFEKFFNFIFLSFTIAKLGNFILKYDVIHVIYIKHLKSFESNAHTISAILALCDIWADIWAIYGQRQE
jgi:hypothetical protein